MKRFLGILTGIGIVLLVVTGCGGASSGTPDKGSTVKQAGASASITSSKAAATAPQQDMQDHANSSPTTVTHQVTTTSTASARSTTSTTAPPTHSATRTPRPSETPTKTGTPSPTITATADPFTHIEGNWSLSGSDQVLTITPNGEWSLTWTDISGVRQLVSGVVYYVNSAVNFNGKVDYVAHPVSGGFFDGQKVTFALQQAGTVLSLTAYATNGLPAAAPEDFQRS